MTRSWGIFSSVLGLPFLDALQIHFFHLVLCFAGHVNYWNAWHLGFHRIPEKIWQYHLWTASYRSLIERKAYCTTIATIWLIQNFVPCSRWLIICVKLPTVIKCRSSLLTMLNPVSVTPSMTHRSAMRQLRWWLIDIFKREQRAEDRTE